MKGLVVSGISKKINESWVLHDINLTQAPFQQLAIAGETGSGKSTLLKIIAGLVQPNSGQVYFENERVKGPDEVLVPGHDAIAYLSQHFELRNNYRVEELLDYANRLSAKNARSLFKLCRIDHLLKRKTDQLSGGEKQRIALTRLLISSPKLLLLDEPFSNLDMIHKSLLQGVVKDISEKLKITILFVSHEPADILSQAEKVMVLKSGKCIQEGTAMDVYQYPVNEYTAALFGPYNLLPSPLWMYLTGTNVNPFPGKKLFLRPGQVGLIVNNSSETMGRISAINIKDGYQDITVSFQQGDVLVRTTDKNLRKEDRVSISFLTDKPWFI